MVGLALPRNLLKRLKVTASDSWQRDQDYDKPSAISEAVFSTRLGTLSVSVIRQRRYWGDDLEEHYGLIVNQGERQCTLSGDSARSLWNYLEYERGAGRKR